MESKQEMKGQWWGGKEGGGKCKCKSKDGGSVEDQTLEERI